MARGTSRAREFGGSRSGGAGDSGGGGSSSCFLPEEVEEFGEARVRGNRGRREPPGRDGLRGLGPEGAPSYFRKRRGLESEGGEKDVEARRRAHGDRPEPAGSKSGEERGIQLGGRERTLFVDDGSNEP